MIAPSAESLYEEKMRTLIIGLLQIVAVVGFILMIATGAYIGYVYEQFLAAQSVAGVAIDPAIGAVIGGLCGLVAGVITFGVIFLLIDIRVQTKRTAQVLEDLARRRPAAQASAPPSNPDV